MDATWAWPSRMRMTSRTRTLMTQNLPANSSPEPARRALLKDALGFTPRALPGGQQDPVCTEVTSVWRLILEPTFHLNTLTARYFWPWQKSASRHGVPAES